MPRIVGVDIPGDKRVEFSLQYIYGVGSHVAKKVLLETNIDPGRKAKDLTEDELARLTTLLDRTYQVEGTLRRAVQSNIARLREIGSYRGNRHRRNLPCRGQRTRTNARTRKGPRKTVAGKKGVKELHRG